jgi:hypothetical protein
MRLPEIKDLLQHILVVLQNIEYLPGHPTQEDIAELKAVSDLKDRVEHALRVIRQEELESN